MSEQMRKAQLTINNPLDLGLNHEVIKASIEDMNMDYACMADEFASTGTLHTHVFIYRSTPFRFSTLKNKFAGAHIEHAYGSIAENVSYVKKDGKWNDTEKSGTCIEGTFEEYGCIPDEANAGKCNKDILIEWINEGMTTADIILRNPKLAFRTKDIDILRQTLMSQNYLKANRNVDVTYVYGETGVGKTRSVFSENEAGSICRITSYLHNGVRFDSYHGQDVLVFEEFHSQIPIPDMLSYLDIYPIVLPARYNDRVACYTKVYILSNLPIEEQYTDVQAHSDATWQAFLRRINHIYEQIDFNSRIEIRKEDLRAKSERCPFI